MTAALHVARPRPCGACLGPTAPEAGAVAGGKIHCPRRSGLGRIRSDRGACARCSARRRPCRALARAPVSAVHAPGRACRSCKASGGGRVPAAALALWVVTDSPAAMEPQAPSMMFPNPPVRVLSAAAGGSPGVTAFPASRRRPRCRSALSAAG
jgi:hypothetical protein